jgi:hypothetical protein
MALGVNVIKTFFICHQRCDKVSCVGGYSDICEQVHNVGDRWKKFMGRVGTWPYPLSLGWHEKPLQLTLLVYSMVIPNPLASNIRPERLAKDKHSCLWRKYLNYVHKSFYSLESREKCRYSYLLLTLWCNKLECFSLKSFQASLLLSNKPRGMYYKTFYGRNLLIFVISKSVCPWWAFPAYLRVENLKGSILG